MEEREKLDRLTDREKQSLRLWLHHKTAKEIALELGISHHAVEKRLKMARTKLGVGSSLEAARMLDEAEGYGRTVAQPPDLPTEAPKEHKWFTKPLTWGVPVMSIFATAVAILFLQSTGVVPGKVSHEGGDRSERLIIHREFDPANRVDATPAEILVIVQNTFRVLDEDGSGFLDGNEMAYTPTEGPQPVYRRDENGNAVPTGETVLRTAEEQRADFYAEADHDGDGKIALHEYRRWASPRFARVGIPRDWKEDINRPVTFDPS